MSGCHASANCAPMTQPPMASSQDLTTESSHVYKIMINSEDQLKKHKQLNKHRHHTHCVMFGVSVDLRAACGPPAGTDAGAGAALPRSEPGPESTHGPDPRPWPLLGSAGPSVACVVPVGTPAVSPLSVGVGVFAGAGVAPYSPEPEPEPEPE